MTDRIHFFSSGDLSLYHYVDRAEKLVLNVQENVEFTSINDALELYHAMRIMKSAHWKDSVPSDRTSKINENCDIIPKIIIKYIRSIDLSEFLSAIDDLELGYFKSLWEIFSNYMPNYLNSETLEKLLKKDSFRIRELLEQEKLVKRHSICIANFLREYPNTAELLLSEFAEEHQLGNYDHIFFPKCLTNDDRNAIISEFIDREEPNLNYVRLAMYAKDCDGLSLDRKIKYKARRKAEELNSKYFNENTGVPMKIEVQITNDTDVKAVETSFGETLWKTVVNTSFLLGSTNIDLIHNFAFLFGYFNKRGYVGLVNKTHNLLLFERLGLTAKNSYPAGIVFQHTNNLAITQIAAVNDLLKKNGRSIECAIKEFYETYLQDNYDYPSPSLNILLDNADYCTKLKAILPEMEAVVKQYNEFVNDGIIDLNFLEMASPLKLTKCRSLIDKKNITLTNDASELKKVMFYFFSDQSMLSHVNPYKDYHYNCLFDLIRNRNGVLYQNYEEYQIGDIDYLINNGYLHKSKDGLLYFSNVYEVMVLYNLYHSEVCSYWLSSFGECQVMDDYIKKGWCKANDNLFSQPEQDWFSYYLNDERFVNAKAYRNHILHGTANMSEDVSHYVYSTLLMLFVILLLKIEQDLATAVELKKKYGYSFPLSNK